MKHTTRFLSTLSTSAFLILASAGCEEGAELAEDNGATRQDLRAERMAEALDLDENQQEQMTALQEQMSEDLSGVEEQLQEKQQQMQTLWAAEAPDRQAILDLGAEIDALHATIRDRRMAFRQSLDGLLDEDQRARFGKRGPGHLGRRGHGKRGPGLHRGGEADGAGPGKRGRGFGRRGKRGHGGGHGMMKGRRMAERLDLDESQQAQVRALRESMQSDLAPVHTQMGELRRQMRAQFTAEQPDEAAIRAIHEQMDELHSTVRERRVDFRLALIPLLNAEQRARLAEMPFMTGHRGRGMGRGHGRGMGRGHGPGHGRGHGPGHGRGLGRGHGRGFGGNAQAPAIE